jgi:hypothetical protein
MDEHFGLVAARDLRRDGNSPQLSIKKCLTRLASLTCRKKTVSFVATVSLIPVIVLVVGRRFCAHPAGRIADFRLPIDDCFSVENVNHKPVILWRVSCLFVSFLLVPAGIPPRVQHDE